MKPIHVIPDSFLRRWWSVGLLALAVLAARAQPSAPYPVVDAGDQIHPPAGPRPLLRLAEGVTVPPDTMAGSAALSAAYPSSPNRGGVTVWRSGKSGARGGKSRAAHLSELAAARALVPAVDPVFVDAASGRLLAPTREIVVQLKPGVRAADYFGADFPRVRPLGGTTDQFILSRPETPAEEVLAESNRRAGDARVVYAAPDFYPEIQTTAPPNDSLFPAQWTLHNSGQSRATPGADLRWLNTRETTRGRADVVIALLDTGVQLNHPDLAANIFSNPGESPNGVDDDLNGYVDDTQGWNFGANHNNPGPATSSENHGTATAGIAAAVGDNFLGVCGVASGSTIMPIKLSNATFSGIAEAIYYAAGRTRDGLRTWRGADVISSSLTWSQSSITDAAFDYATTRGRGGRGCPVFCAAGNSAGAWQPISALMPPGTFTFSWFYNKDSSFSAGDDTAWLDSVEFPDGSEERFEGGIPAGWVTGGDAPWTSVQDAVAGNHALTGWDGPGSRSVRAGRVGDGQLSYLAVTRTGPSGVFKFWTWVSSELGYDRLFFFINTNLIVNISGVPNVNAALSYPASHPRTIAVGASTDFDYRADYSQYGSGLDFLAPSSGGRGAVVTTDRTGADGYNTAGDYHTGFGGTSASAPAAAGVAALALAVNPSLTAEGVRQLLRAACDKIGGVTYTGGFHSHYGYGRLNADKAVALAGQRISTLTVQGNTVTVRFPSDERFNYRLLRGSAASGGTWTAVGTIVAGTGGVMQVADTASRPASARQFYRMEVLP